MAEDKKEQKMDLSISEEVAKGVFSNLAILSHTESEIFVDFASYSPVTPKPVVRSRIIMSPLNAKRLLHALQERISSFKHPVFSQPKNHNCRSSG